jgi:hypothetical protein
LFWLIPVLIVLLAVVVGVAAIRVVAGRMPALLRARRRAEQAVRRVDLLQPRLIDLQQEITVVQDRAAGLAARVAEIKERHQA